MSARETGRWQCPPKSVLVAVDFGEASARALAIAGVVATAFNAKLRAVHAERFEAPPYFTLEQIARLEAERHMAQTAAREHLARFASEASGLVVESVVVDERPVEAILEASADADLIVLGTHGRSGPGRWWLGSVAERVVRAATIPVLVTRAAVTPPREVFERLALVSDGGDTSPARRYAEHLGSIAGGSLLDAGRAGECEGDVLQRMSLVVMSMGSVRQADGITSAVGRMIGACHRPVLFVPEP